VKTNCTVLFPYTRIYSESLNLVLPKALRLGLGRFRAVSFN
jgi:hypothetical protein